ncbi:cadherin-like protein 26 isoform X2 [Pogona vitticeps]
MLAAWRALFPAAGRGRRGAELFLLAVVAVNILHHSLCNNSSLRKSIQKRSSQGQDQKLLDSLCPLRRTKRRWVITTLELDEEDKGPFPKFIGQLFNDVARDLSVKYLISGPGVDENPEIGLFSIEDDANGNVYVHRCIDREKTPSFTIHFDVANRETGEIVDRSLLFNVKIKDINDNAPEFPKKEYNITMTEKQSRGNLVFNVTAFDRDEEGTENSEVTYSMVSQAPRSKQPGFTVDPSTGQIHSTGCSSYEPASAFRLLIKATDHGFPPQSSTATVNIVVEDSNNNMPTFTKEEYHLDVPEGKTEHNILRLPVEDKDSPNTTAWIAKYRIVQGNENGNFFIETDPKSNEGVLSIVKPLIYDGLPGKNLVISVENEEDFFLCEGGLAKTAPPPAASKARVNINVIDKNDAPQFNPSVLVLQQEEGVKPGVRIGQYIAKDPDTSRHVVRYKIASDPDGWVTIDENSGTVLTAKTLDRESPHTNNNIYTVVVHAIDDGVPPLTGTGTIHIYLNDLNDNAPALVTPPLLVCDGDMGPFLVEAEDKDSHPYAGPFTFQIPENSGNVQNFWKLGTNLDDSVELFMLESLPPGNYSLPLHISDKQGFFKEQNLHVRVCSCQDGICEEKSGLASASVSLGGGAIGVIVAAFLLLILGLALLLWCSVASKTEKGHPFIPFETGNQSLIQYNEESKHVLSQDVPDVKIDTTSPPEYAQVSKEKTQTVKDTLGVNRAKPLEISNPPNGMIGSPLTAQEDFQTVSAWDQQATLRPQSNKMHWVMPRDQIVETVGGLLNQKCEHISYLEDTLVSYSPRVFAEEGPLEKSGSIWSLHIVDDDDSLPPDFLDTLGPRFAMLGRICSK